jgi:hypothetical protein
MFRAWRTAGPRLKRRPAVDLRWTRVCFCGQQTSAGRIGDPLLGLPFLTGSEENRGPLFDVTGVPFEGRRAPIEAFESHGHKIGVPFALSAENYPTAVPLFVVRVGPRVIASLPAEPTVEVGRRTRAAVMDAARGRGVRGAVIAGLANEFIQYLTTPEEYDRQHYEGGSTIFGPASSVLLNEELAELASRLVRGRPAQEPHPFDPRAGVTADGAPYGKGAASAKALRQPLDTPPGGQAVFDWRGGARGLDLRLDRRFISIQRRAPGGWRRVADDLGLAIAWTVDDERRYSMHWQVPRGARKGIYRVLVTANRYRLRSSRFAVRRSAPNVVVDPDHPASEFGPITNR